MDISLRPFNPESDFEGRAALQNTVETEAVTGDELREREGDAPRDRIVARTTAVDGQGKIVGMSSVGRENWMKPGHFWFWLVVEPALYGHGIGSLLYNEVERFLREHEASYAETTVRESHPEGQRFAQQRGFTIQKLTFESALNLACFDESPFAGTIEAVEAAGIRFFTLADEGNTEEAQRKLYEINRRFAADNPGNDEPFAPFENFRQFVFAASWFLPDGQILAAEGDRWVGLGALGYFKHSNSAYNMFTGVDPAYRGRHIALALKLLATRCARRYGATHIRTNNDSRNASMLAVNRKLGYQPEPGIYTMGRYWGLLMNLANQNRP